MASVGNITIRIDASALERAIERVLAKYGGHEALEEFAKRLRMEDDVEAAMHEANGPGRDVADLLCSMNRTKHLADEIAKDVERDLHRPDSRA